MAKQLLFGDEARRRLKAGLDRAAEAVAITLGPKGRNVGLDQKEGPPLLTSNGAMVAGELEWAEPYENMGAQLLKEAATKTNELAGDGAATAMVLAQALVSEGLKNIAAGANPMLLKRGLEKATQAVSTAILALAIPIYTHAELAAVAATSAQDREIGVLIAGALEKAGPDGAVTIEEGYGLGVDTEYVEGMQFRQGYLSPYFITHAESMETILEEPYLLLCDQRITTAAALSPLLEKLAHLSHRNLVIIADDIAGEALAMLVLTKLQGNFNLVAVKTPGFDHHRRGTLDDIAILTGGTVVSEEAGRRIESATLADLGSCDRVVITKDETTLIGGHGKPSALKERLNQIKTEIEHSTRDYDKKKRQERLARLVGGVVIIKVGAATGIELKEKKQRLEKALKATRAALAAGVVPGGGVALLNAGAALAGLIPRHPDEAAGVKVMRRALAEPMRRLARNAGLAGAVTVANVRYRQQVEQNDRIGYDVISERYQDMVLAGIIDPARAVCEALENAASVAAMILTIEVLVA